MNYVITRVRKPRLSRLPFLKTVRALLLSAVLFVTGCKKPEVDLTDALIANAGPDQTVQVGQTVKLDGSHSGDGLGKPITYQWTVVRKPAASSSTLSAPTTANPTFVADEVGEYELELAVSNGAIQRVDKVRITASAAQPLTLDKDITVKTVLEDRIANPALPDYIVPRSIAVKHELTIKPGVVIAFERDVRFDINDEGGILIARGTADKKIRFVGVGQTKGYWVGIMLYSESNVNVMEYAEVLHAGSRTMLDGKKTGMALFKQSQIALKNTLFSQHDGYGLLVQEDAILREFATNAFRTNTEAGIIVSTENVAKLDAASLFTSGNGRNVVEVNGSYIGHSDGRDGEISWKGFADKTPYRLLNTIAVRTGWRLNPGVTIEAARDVTVIINEEGYLLAKGTAEQTIRFTGAANATAYWTGILSHSTNRQNSIEQAEISNAGSKAIVSGKRANLALYGHDATITIRNTRISGGGGYGILVGYYASTNEDVKTSNTFDGNAQANVQHEQ